MGLVMHADHLRGWSVLGLLAHQRRVLGLHAALCCWRLGLYDDRVRDTFDGLCLVAPHHDACLTDLHALPRRCIHSDD
jgi:hypothetical protein